jgi:hypothetical protein
MATLPLPARAGIFAAMPRSLRVALLASGLLTALGVLRIVVSLAGIEVSDRLRFFISPIWLTIPAVVLAGVLLRRERARTVAFGLALLWATLLAVVLLVIPLVAAITGTFTGEVPTGALVLLVALHAAVAWGLSRRDAKAWFAATKA